MAVLPERGMHPVFELGAQAAEHHAGSWQLALITHHRGGDPSRGERPRSLQSVNPFGVELVALIDATHHQFSQPSIDQLRCCTPGFDLINHPVPVSYRLDRNHRSAAPAANKILDGPMAMGQATLINSFSLWIFYPCPSVVLVNIQCDVFHNGCPPRLVILATAVTQSIAFIIIRTTTGAILKSR